MVEHDHVAKKFAFELVTIKIQAVQNRYDKRRAGKNLQARIDVCRNVINRTFDADSRVHVAPLVTQTKTITSADTKVVGVNKVGIAAYLEDSAGNKQQTCNVQDFEF